MEVGGVFTDLSGAARVTKPVELGVWWELIAYFSLSTISAFVLSHILFGIGGAIFFFARGAYDVTLISYLETTISGWPSSNIPGSEICMVLITLIILGVNLPLCLWSGQLGVQRSFYTLSRLRRKPINPEFGSDPLYNLIKIVSASLVTGLVAAVIFSHA